MVGTMRQLAVAQWCPACRLDVLACVQWVQKRLPRPVLGNERGERVRRLGSRLGSLVGSVERILRALPVLWTTALCLLFLSQPAQAQGRPARMDAESPEMRIVLIGHLYSLTVDQHTKEGKPFHVEEHLELLAAEVEKLQPNAVFLLGDVTRKGQAEEWAAVQKAFASQSAPLHVLPGNHDLSPGLAAYRGAGGAANRSVIVGETKFILLGHESFPNQLPNPELVEFIDRELQDHADYREAVILMHFLLKGQPFWEAEIVPLLRGRVRRVFTGNLVQHHLAAQPDRENDILYIGTSFKFKGEGPPIFVVLEQGDMGLRAIPHALPLELSDSWYEANPETAIAWLMARLRRLPLWLVTAVLLLALAMGVLSIIGLHSLIRRSN